MKVLRKINRFWICFWMYFAGTSYLGRVATWLATRRTPPHTGRWFLRQLNPKGFISYNAMIHHSDLRIGPHVYIGDRAIVYQARRGGSVELGEEVRIGDYAVIETGEGGSITIGDNTRVQFRCHLAAYVSSIKIGTDVGIAPGCGFYSHNHGHSQKDHHKLYAKGPIIVEDGAWLGAGVLVLSGVRIGREAVIAAGSVVTRDVPDGAIAAGVPARVLKMRTEMHSGD